MTLEGIRALLVEDSPSDARVLTELIRDHPAGHLNLDHVDTLRGAFDRLSQDHYDVVLLDLHLPDSNGIETVARMHTEVPRIPIVVLTGLDDEGLAVKSVRAGAQDYLVKGHVDGDLLIRSLRYASERGRAVEALERREEHYRSLIENSLDLISILNPDGTIRYASPSHERVLGYSMDELVGQNALSFVHPEDRAAVKTRIEDPEEGATMQFRFLHKDKSWRVIESSGRNLGHLAGVRGVVVNSRDVTERKRLEEELHHAQRLEAVGRLAGGVAHDFNNLLMVITGYSQMLLDNASPADPARADLEQVVKAAGRATELTRQLLAFSRRQVVRPVLVDLNLLIQDMERMLTRVVGPEIELSVGLAPALQAVCADAGQIEQVLLNLALNSRDAMADGGKLRIETANVHVIDDSGRSHPMRTPGHYVILSVIDSGAGMAPEVLSRIFEPFFTTKERGTGLGLSTSYGIIKQSGGEIWAESKPGCGTTFRIYLPATEKPVPAVEETLPANPKEKLAPAATETILLVEDEEGVRHVVAAMLRGQGYKVLATASNKDAINVAKQHRETIHLLITDPVNPRAGRKMAESLVAQRPEMRVLYVSSFHEQFTTEMESSFLQKPFSNEELAVKVRSLLQAD